MDRHNDGVMNIHVTETYSCHKPAWFRMQGVNKAPEHYYTLRGTLLHSHIEDFLKANLSRNSVNQYWDINKTVDQLRLSPLVAEKLKEELQNGWKNFLDFYKDHLMEFAYKREHIKLVEEALEMELRDGFKLVGRPDLVTDKTIWDFKSGKASRSVSKEYKLQLSLYKLLLNDKDLRLRLVFLGGPRYEVKEVIADDGLTLDMMRVINQAIEHRKSMIEGNEPPAKFSFYCSMCGYRHVCRGV